mmetsp:Transcript_43796/g.126515  ORF Transcript_43796/g.126515 Transcript_43796/m.126515 type:complete len:455 (-) Transcript_43796:51-1415(-)
MKASFDLGCILCILLANPSLGFSTPPRCGDRLQKRPTFLSANDRAEVVTIFQYSPTSLKHLENTELPDDYSRPWTEAKVKALAAGVALGTILGVGGEIVFQNVLDIEKTFVLWGGLGIAGGWYLGGGKEVAESEKPINGGYDRKLIADRPSRLESVLKSISEAGLTIGELSSEDSSARDLSKVTEYAKEVHSAEYLDMLKRRSAEADRPQRLNPVYSRTLIDQHSYGAALNAAADWIESVDSALAEDKVKFALVRPPSHHACRAKGMGGCLLNSVAIAAKYALDQPNIKNVAILDIDAHHGNGIAHCVQDMANVRYCSIHEDASSGFLGRSADDPNDPRSASSEDRGPLSNILNINLPAGTSWENGYKSSLVEKAIPFLAAGNPDILLVAAGFDALEADLTSRLNLQPGDYECIAKILREKFGNRIATGLEGGYCWQNGELNEAILAFVNPWRQ